MAWLAIAFVALFAVGAAHPAPPATWSHYESAAGWSIRHPPEWAPTELAPTGEAVVFAPTEGGADPGTPSLMVVVQPRPSGGIDAFVDAYLAALEQKYPDLQTPFVSVDRGPFRPRAEIESWETHPQGQRYFSRTFLFHGGEVVLLEAEVRAPIDLRGDDGATLRAMTASWRG